MHRERLRRALLIAGIALMSCSATPAGPNAGGTLLIHPNPSIAYPSDDGTYCGQDGLTDCTSAITSVAGPDNYVFFAIAAFRSDGFPRMSGVTFGLDHSADELVLLQYGHCADFELATSDGPQPGSGTELSWNSPQTAHLTEVYWFAGYSDVSPQPTLFALVPHPFQWGVFADNQTPANIDPIAA